VEVRPRLYRGLELEHPLASSQDLVVMWLP
jgi:hypothetical protein